MHPFPNHVAWFLDALGVPADERELPIERVLDTGMVVEFREHEGLAFAVGILNEMPLAQDDPALERLLEDQDRFIAGVRTRLAYDTDSCQLLGWREIPHFEHPQEAGDFLKSFCQELEPHYSRLSLLGIV